MFCIVIWSEMFRTCCMAIWRLWPAYGRLLWEHNPIVCRSLSQKKEVKLTTSIQMSFLRNIWRVEYESSHQPLGPATHDAVGNEALRIAVVAPFTTFGTKLLQSFVRPLWVIECGSFPAITPRLWDASRHEITRQPMQGIDYSLRQRRT